MLGSQAPPITGLTWIKGQPISIGGAVNAEGTKRVTVVEAWATWCPPCRESIPHLSRLQQQYSDREVYIVGITTESDGAAVSKFVSSMGHDMSYRVAMDTSGAMQRGVMVPSGARGIPHAFILDIDNKIVHSGHPADPAFARALAAAAAKASPREGGTSASADGGADAQVNGTSTAAAMPLPLITDSHDELMQKSAKELKAMLTERGIELTGLLEKGDFAQRVVERCSKVTYYKASHGPGQVPAATAKASAAAGDSSARCTGESCCR